MSAFFRELVAFGIYKRNQGRICRQITLAAMVITMALGFYCLSDVLIEYERWIQFSIPGALFLLGRLLVTTGRGLARIVLDFLGHVDFS